MAELDAAGRRIVSLTSIASRAHLLPAVLGSILDQTAPPDVVHLNVSAEPYLADTGISEAGLPDAVRAMIDAGRVTLNMVANTGPYRKLMPALERHAGEDCVIITADDDVLYPRSWIAGLVRAHQAAGMVAGYRCRSMKHGPDGLRPYRAWRLMGVEEADFGDIAEASQPLFVCPTGRDGVLYRPEYFQDLALLAQLRDIAPKQDDLAFRTYLTVKGIGAAVAPMPIKGKQFPKAGNTETSLWEGNKDANDRAVAALFSFLERQGLMDWSRYTGG